MRLIVQIPCYEEARQLPTTLAELPHLLPGVDEVVWLVVDDGSEDATAEVARACGADYVLRLKRHRGLAAACQAGMDASLRASADVIVTIDADGQFDGNDIPRLMAPLLAGEADMTIGDRDLRHVSYFSGRKRRLQRIGSAVVRKVSGTRVRDATSGFRAYTREAAIATEVLCGFTYTLDTLIRAGRTGLAIQNVRVSTEPAPRPSRLYSSEWSYLRRALISICRSCARYAPLRMFLPAAAAAATVGAALVIAWGAPTPSLAAAVVMGTLAVHLAVVGLVGCLVAESDRLTDAALVALKRLELEVGDFVAGVPIAREPSVAPESAEVRYDVSPSDVGPSTPQPTAKLPHAAR